MNRYFKNVGEDNYKDFAYETITTIFRSLLTINDLEWLMPRLNQWVEDEIKARTIK